MTLLKTISFMREISPEELGELASGNPDWDPDLHCMKLRVITPQMQEQERIEEKKRHGQFVDEPVCDPQEILLNVIPRNNLRIPFHSGWFDYDSDAELFYKAVAQINDIDLGRLGRETMGRTLNMFLDVVFKHRGLRMRNKGDPPHMSHQERRNRHWQAVIDESSLARLFSQRLFAMSPSCSILNDKIDKVSGWFEENDPEDVKSFEYLHPERQKAHAPRAKAHNKRKGNPNSRKSKAATLPPWATVRQKRRRQTNTPLPATRPDQTQPPLPIPVPDREIELPERIRKAEGGRRN